MNVCSILLSATVTLAVVLQPMRAQPSAMIDPCHGAAGLVGGSARPMPSGDISSRGDAILSSHSLGLTRCAGGVHIRSGLPVLHWTLAGGPGGENHNQGGGGGGTARTVHGFKFGDQRATAADAMVGTLCASTGLRSRRLPPDHGGNGGGTARARNLVPSRGIIAVAMAL